jgi:hypothetical protein
MSPFVFVRVWYFTERQNQKLGSRFCDVNIFMNFLHKVGLRES